MHQEETMKITRRGSYADHGTKSIELKEPRLSWDAKDGCIKIKQDSIGDFSTGSRHDYDVSISLSELADILNVVGEKPVNDTPEIISSSLSKSLKPLLRIVFTCIGLVGQLGEFKADA